MPEPSKCWENLFCHACKNMVGMGTFLLTEKEGRPTQCIHTLQKTAMHHNKFPFSLDLAVFFIDHSIFCNVHTQDCLQLKFSHRRGLTHHSARQPSAAHVKIQWKCAPFPHGHFFGKLCVNGNTLLVIQQLPKDTKFPTLLPHPTFPHHKCGFVPCTHGWIVGRPFCHESECFWILIRFVLQVCQHAGGHHVVGNAFQ